MLKLPFVVLDVETSGIDPKRDQVIEVALIRYEQGKEVARYESLVTCATPLPEIVKAITNITDKMLADEGKDRKEVLKKVDELLEGAYLVGHNIAFDAGFLKSMGSKAHLLGHLDTIPIAQILYPSATSYSLESLTEDLGIVQETRHRAMEDVKATLELLKKLWSMLEALPAVLIKDIQWVIERSGWEGGVFFAEATGKSGKANRPVPADMQGELHATGVSRALEIDEIFKADGVMARAFEGYEARTQQVEMANHVMNAFDQGYHLVCEAPTGVGKSLAYLTAAANIALKNKSKVVISTATINLQEQLHKKDIPLLHKLYMEATQHPGARTAILKGRSHYLCLRRLAEFRRRPKFSQLEAILLVKILVWQETTQTGDSAEIHLTREENLVWDFELCSDKKYCSPKKCEPFGECYLHKARAMAEDADIIIVNHALLCADMDMEGTLLPEYNYLVIDEAHHFEEASTDALSVEIRQENLTLGIRVIKNHIGDLRDQLTEGGRHPQKVMEIIAQSLEAAGPLEQFIDNFFSLIALFVGHHVPESSYEENLLINRQITALADWVNMSSSMDDLGKKLGAWLSGLRELTDAVTLTADEHSSSAEIFTDELMQEISLLGEQVSGLKNFFNEDHGGLTLIRWMTSHQSGTVGINMAPVLVGPQLKERLYDKKKSIILTSATLGVQLKNEGYDGREQHPFTYLRQMLSLDDKFEEVTLDSPFNFETQAYVLLPTDAESVMAKSSVEQMSQFFSSLIKAVGGALMGLFTSYSAIEGIYLNLMKEGLQHTARILAQRISGGRNKIMKSYLSDPTHSVIMGTNSFWEGVDIQGSALTTVVIHKLPFDVPNDPVHTVRGELFHNAFSEYTLPRAVLRFRQGFGRLIRSRKDYGCLIVLDNRVTTKEYGKMFLQSLGGVTIEKLPLMEIPAKVKEWLELSKNS